MTCRNEVVANRCCLFEIFKVSIRFETSNWVFNWRHNTIHNIFMCICYDRMLAIHGTWCLFFIYFICWRHHKQQFSYHPSKCRNSRKSHIHFRTVHGIHRIPLECETVQLMHLYIVSINQSIFYTHFSLFPSDWPLIFLMYFNPLLWSPFAIASEQLVFQCYWWTRK